MTNQEIFEFDLKVRSVPDRIAELEKDPVRAASLARARQNLRVWMNAEYPERLYKNNKDGGYT